ncbi:hypothetical protein [Ralstonia pickettii]|uniref:hypothetical protein n=1 Tax=Ralstonia pickettii TaxID=329 RepID=UPI001F2A4923|nr:hypothetical protein [Ralstonia pickettii]
MDTTEGRSLVSWMAALMACTKPAWVLTVKYTASVAPGAVAPPTSRSSTTSPSGPLGSPVGRFAPCPTGTAVTVGTGTPSSWKYARRPSSR